MMKQSVFAVLAMLAATAVIFATFPVEEDAIWLDIQNRQTLVFAVDATFPPFSALDGNGNYGGFDVELARVLAKEMGLTPQFRLVSFDSLLGATVVRQADVAISAIVLQPARTEEVYFSTPYFNAGTRLISPQQQIERPVVDWLLGKTIVVELGSQGDVIVRRLEKAQLDVTVLRVSSVMELEKTLATGQAEVGLADVVAAFEIIKANPTWTSTHAETVPYVMASAKQSPLLHQEIEVALTQLEESGVLPDLRQKWFGTEASVLSFAP